MSKTRIIMAALGAATALTMVVVACSDSQEAARVSMPVFADGSALVATTTALGYTVTVTRARMAVRGVEFTTNGELHGHGEPLWRRLLVPQAQAHPGHHAGGELIGELSGRHIIEWGDRQVSAAPLGDATLIAGKYNGANLTMTRGQAADGLPSSDPLLDVTLHLEGESVRMGKTTRFIAQIKQDEGRQVIGAPMDHHVKATTRGAVHLMLRAQDPASGASMFEGVDFDALPKDDQGRALIQEGSPAHNLMRRALSSHEHYQVRVIEE